MVARATRGHGAERAAVTRGPTSRPRSSRSSSWPPSTGCGRPGAACGRGRRGPATASGRPLRQRPAGPGAARGWALATAGATMAAMAAVTARRGRRRHPVRSHLALLVLLPLALAEVAAPLADAGALSVRTDAAAARLSRLARTAPAVRDTVAQVADRSARRGRRPGQRSVGRQRPRHRGAARCGWTRASGSRWSGPSGSGKSTLRRTAAPVPRPRLAARCGTAAGAPRPRTRRRTPVHRAGRRRPARLRHHARRERAARPAGRHRRRGRRRAPPGPAGRLARPACPTGWTPGSATATPGSRAASAPGSAWPAHCSPTSRSWSSTSPPATSTTRPPPRSPASCSTGARSALGPLDHPHRRRSRPGRPRGRPDLIAEPGPDPRPERSSLTPGRVSLGRTGLAVAVRARDAAAGGRCRRARSARPAAA